MGRRAVRAAVLLSLIARAAGQAPQVVVTIVIGYCSTRSSNTASLSSLLPGYSSNAPDYGSMTGPSSNIAGPSRISSETHATLSSSFSVSTPSSSSFQDRYGQLYTVDSNTGLSGVAIEAQASGAKRRQAKSDSSETALEDCAASCSLTPQCQAVFSMGATCILYASVRSTMFLLGGEAAFNTARFTGFTNVTVGTSSSSNPTSPTLRSETYTVRATGATSLPNLSSLDSSSIAQEISSTMTSSSPVTISSYPMASSESIYTPLSTSGEASAPSDNGSGSARTSSVTIPSPETSPLVTPATSSLDSITPISSPGALAPSSSISSTTATSGDLSQLTASSSATAPYTAPTYVCPADTSKTITDVNGIQYNLMCRSDTYGLDFGQGAASTSFNDCFRFCDATSACAGFTYLGGADGARAGNCYLKKGPMYFQGGGINVVSAIRVTPQQPAGASNSTVPPSSSVDVTDSVAMSISTSGGPGVSSSGLISSVSSSLVNSFPALGTSTRSSSPGSYPTIASPSPSISTTSTLSLLTSPATPSSSSATLSSSPSSNSPDALTSATPSTALSPSSSTTSSPASPSYVRNTGKRGLCYTNDSYTLPYSLSGQNSQVSWGYDYYYSPYTSNDHIRNPALTFIPLLFNDASDLAQAWPGGAQAALSAGADALLSFNEPDLCYPGSACMTINQSVTAYRHSMMPFASSTRLGAPAVTNSGASGTSLTYLSWFLGNCTACQVDFVALHWYSNVYAFAYLQAYIRQAHALFPTLPLWLTEFGLDNSEGTPSDAQVQAFLRQALPWLDAVPYLERYAWFYDGPGYLVDAQGMGLSAQGVLYNSFTAPCEDWDNSDGHC